MTNITNPKIEKANNEIEKTKAKIAVLQTKLREQEGKKKALEDLEIVALFRAERLGSISELISERQEPGTGAAGYSAQYENNEEDNG